MEYQNKRKLSELIVGSFEGVLTDQQRQELNEMVGSSREAAEWYIEFMDMLTCFTKYGTTDFAGFDLEGEYDIEPDLEHSGLEGYQSVTDSNVSLRGVDLNEFIPDRDAGGDEDDDLTIAMLELLEMERTAPAVEEEKTTAVKPKRELIQKVDRDFKLFPGEGNKSVSFAYLALAACIMVFVGYVHFFVHDPVERPVVAKLDDSINAVWDNKLEIPDGFDDMVQGRYRLRGGYASIVFNEGAKVTIEGPAELSLNSSGDMELFSGKIYAIVPERAHGFAVKADVCKIVDLGTEFGVEIDSKKNTQLHVTKGSTILFSGSDNGSEPKISVDAGGAKKVYNDGFVKDIALVNEKFVRVIDSKAGVVWNGISNIGPSGDGVVFSESFENPVVKGYLENSVPSASWIGSEEGYCAGNRGLINEGVGGVFSTPYGNQAFLLDYTNSGLVTSEDAIGEVLTAGTTYAVTFNAAYTPIVSPPKINEVKDEAEFKKNLIKTDESDYRVELVVFEPGAYRGDFRYSKNLRGGDVLAEAYGTVGSNDMSVSDSIVFTPEADDPNLGKKIAIRLVKTSGSIIYDNIKLRIWKPGNKESFRAE